MVVFLIIHSHGYLAVPVRSSLLCAAHSNATDVQYRRAQTFTDAQLATSNKQLPEVDIYARIDQLHEYGVIHMNNDKRNNNKNG